MSRNTVTKRTISLDPEVDTKGKERAVRLGFNNSFSAYVNRLIRDDLEREAKERAHESTRLHEEAKAA